MRSIETTPGGIVAPRMRVERRAGGGWCCWTEETLQPTAPTVLHELQRWAEADPQRVFLAQRGPDGAWVRWRYGEALAESVALAQSWHEAGARPSEHLLILAPNGIDHARVMLAGLWAQLQVVPLNPRYAGSESGLEKLRQIVQRLSPRQAWLEETAATPACIALLQQAGVALRAGSAEQPPASPPALPWPADRTVAKLICTSGSTGTPKAVPYTHRMMTSNLQMVLQRWPLLAERPLVMVDWLPWSHVFGGNNNLNLVLRLGGTLYVDEGTPTPQGLATTLANLREVSPTFYCNVPAGFTALASAMAEDAVLRRRFFAELQALFFAGAAMPAPTLQRLHEMARAERGTTVPVLSGWGATESGPSATLVHAPALPAGHIGALAPGVDLQLVPNQEKLEAWIRSPSVARSYVNDDAASRGAFDDEGWFHSGDALRFADESRPEDGFVYDGRIAEDFKLENGTWVDAGGLRLALLKAGEGWLRDVLLLGPNRPWLAALAWLDPDAPALSPEATRARLETVLAAFHAGTGGDHGGSASRRVRRLAVLHTPPSLALGEVNEKGHVNAARSRELRAAEADRLYAEADHAGMSGTHSAHAAVRSADGRPADRIDRHA